MTLASRNRLSVLSILLLTVVMWISFYTFSEVKVSEQLCKEQQLLHRVEIEVLKGREQTDQFLIDYIRHFHIYPPSNSTRRYSKLYSWRTKYINESRDAIQTIQLYLKNMTGGIFVEAGASNGADELSNTLVLERDYNWTGLLVEGSPVIFPRLRAAHRKCWISDVLLSSQAYADVVIFTQTDNVYAGKITEDGVQRKLVEVLNENGIPEYVYEVLSVPFFSLVKALKFKTIDYLSLDVEGSELEVLKTIPFNKIHIKTMTAEINLISKGKQLEIVGFLRNKGFVRVGMIGGEIRDYIFAHESLVF